MNFFEQQDLAKRNTTRLVVLLGLAVISLILVTTALFAFLMYYLQTGNSHYHMQTTNMGFWQSLGTLVSWQSLGSITFVVLAVVLLGGVFKYLQLQGGGRTVAESLGGRLIDSSTQDPDERKVLNIVEEMAIASGTSVPPVYVLEDQAINAFAAGLSPKDAVIGVTRGCIRELNRDQLQGVVAHEFSHIFHGDMRLNMRLVAILNGILLIGLIGHFIVRSTAYRRIGSSRDNKAGGIVLLGIGLMVVGYAGTFFGNLIKAAVSRQREFLADASAVQFTRNPDGIAGALKKIGGYKGGTKLEASHSAEFSHMFFGQGVSTAFNAMMATHPPLPERIRRIEPNWDGGYLAAGNATASTTHTSAAASQFAGAAASMSSHDISTAVDHIGTPGPSHLACARTLLLSLGEDIRDQAHDPFAARGLVFGLLLDKDKTERQKQLQLLGNDYSNTELQGLKPAMTRAYQLPEQQRLAVIELALPALQMLSQSQAERFLHAIDTLVMADNHINVMEWSVRRIVRYHLSPPEGFRGDKHLRQLREQCQQVLSFVAHAGSHDAAECEQAFARACEQLRLGTLSLLPLSELTTDKLDSALDALNHIKPLQKPQLLKAMLACIEHDGQINVSEAELFRAVADSLGCPVPPVMPNA